ncbi:L-2-hydroxyglutarate dehydrogenase, mitochondrial isoform X2 [Toxorhynchites rutilus septentrionalis]|nr:L-2-hydroxyglutarate dehydrogenase, mitochondrial isoform X2 [Toxorhynchites rutilus septentrionalis]XP_055629390.1 L-2-hydroxyglutarate dehydrogenase, mitochondrial isoform X2 [Toxorhynchites rutilus septentrionalis]XP_055629391.1 L-2-hydroxyglutarate dehydrogenase, mitochondrial isoform X2 [Toxorhynchites rutilus septentrionalis]
MLTKTIDRAVLGLYSFANGKLNGCDRILTPTLRAYSHKAKRPYDIVVVGGGIVGTASAREILLRHPSLRVAIVEKEPKLAFHQSGHNSGVIHAGIYYKPGSLKARLCVEGLHLSYKYFDEKNVPYKKVGKLIVATNDVEVKRLDELYQRAIANKVPDVEIVDSERIKELEPYCQGLKAIWSPHTGIVDWGRVTQYYAKDFKNAGGDVYLNFEVSKFEESTDPEYPIVVKCKKNETIQSKYILTCGGLQSDKVAELTGCSPLPKIVPFRGEYLLLNPDKCHMVKGNIYPVPDPRFPFLGVHFTPRMDGSVWLGPNAVLAFKREGYKWSDFNARELVDALKFPGLIKMSLKFWSAGLYEIAKSALIPLQVRELQKFIPDVQEYDVQRGPAGVRAQALDSYGNLVDDFVFDHGKGDTALARNILHCRNAPSPGATSSLAIAKMIADKIESQFSIK